jgi:hypothetical protein
MQAGLTACMLLRKADNIPGRVWLHQPDGVSGRQRLWSFGSQDEDTPVGHLAHTLSRLEQCLTFGNTSLDSDTVGILSTATTQSALLNHEVYLTDRLDNQTREKMRHLRCLCFIRPSPNSIQLLIDELREPKYGEYNICVCPNLGPRARADSSRL